MKKTCEICGIEYYVSTGHSKYCKACRYTTRNIKRREYYQKNKDYCISIAKRYYQSHRAECCERAKKYRCSKIEELREYERNYRAKNIEKIREYNRVYKNANREKIRQQNRESKKRCYIPHPRVINPVKNNSLILDRFGLTADEVAQMSQKFVKVYS